MKKFNLLCIFLITVFFITSCTDGGSVSAPLSNQPDDKKAVQINVVTSYGGDDGNRKNYENAFKAYEAVSGNIIKDSSGISNEEWKSQIMAGFENGTEPDILFYFTGVDSNKLIENGKVVSIDEIRSVYPDYASNMEDSKLAKSPVDGKSYAVPVNGYWEGMYVNKKVLADCGVEIPNEKTTWEQFLSDCQKIADKGYIPIAASLQEVPHYWFEFCVLNNGSLENHLMLPKSSNDVIGKIWANGLNDIKNLYTRGFFPENTTTAANAEADVLLIDNKAAFMIDGSWKMGWLSENAADINDFTVTYIPGKGERKSTDIIGGLSMGYFITRKAWDNPEKQAACVEFIKAMTTDEVVATFDITAITALKNSIMPSTDASNLVKDALSMLNGITGIVAAVGDELLPELRSSLFNNVKNIASETITADEAITQYITEAIAQ